MPGHGAALVKHEPASDEDDADSLLAANSALYTPQHSCTEGQHEIKLEARYEHASRLHVANDSVPTHLLHLQNADALEELSPAGPAATPVQVKPEPREPALLQTLEPQPRDRNAISTLNMGHHMMLGAEDAQSAEFVPLLSVKDEPLSEGEQQQLSGEDTSDSCGGEPLASPKAVKTWSQRDMDNALEALRKHNMSLTKASATYGIPSTTLWQRAHRLGIDTPKKEGAAKSWSQQHLRAALHALRTGAISANKASKAYGIPSSTLYKIARREGIRLAAPFNAAPTAWSAAALSRALHDIRCGRASVQRASAQYGIPTGTLYGRCKREGIELSRSNPTPWSEDAMGEALEAVRVGQMSINQAAIHYNLPYSSLYGRFKRCKYQPQPLQQMPQQNAVQDPVDVEQHTEYYGHYHNQASQDNRGIHAAEQTNPYSMQHMPAEIEHTLHSPPYSNVVMPGEVYGHGGQAMYYSQNGITTS